MNGAATTAKTIRIIAAIASLMTIVILFGCGASTQHKMVTHECEECKKKGVEIYEVEEPIGAIKTGSEFVVKADEEVYLCRPQFTTERGAKYIPFKSAVFDMKNGEVLLHLKPGVYALCLDRGDSCVGQLVVVSEDCTDSPEIELK